MNERVRNIYEIIRQTQQISVLPMRVLDVARMMEDSLPEDASSDGIHFALRQAKGHRVAEWRLPQAYKLR